MLASMSLRIKIRPARMTFTARESFPISDRSACFVHFGRVKKVCSSCTIAASFSPGRLAQRSVCGGPARRKSSK